MKCEAGEEAAGPVGVGAGAGAGGGAASGKSASKSKKGSASSAREDASGKKEYNHHARACFDRAKAFALKVSSCVLGWQLRDSRVIIARPTRPGSQT